MIYNLLMDKEELRIQQEALEFAKRNKVRIAKDFTDSEKYSPDKLPVSVFMAGSPGAGKTEFSKNLITILEQNRENKVVRIDADEVRPFIPGYTGKNSYLFQGAASIIVEKMHDLVLSNKQTFILDGTFSKYEKAVDNIKRSLAKERSVFIFYLYQKPEVAWKFTRAREESEGRKIPKDSFIDHFLGSRETVHHVRKTFGQEVVVFLVKKDFKKNIVEDIAKIERDGNQIDDHIHDRYTVNNLKNIL